MLSYKQGWLRPHETSHKLPERSEQPRTTEDVSDRQRTELPMAYGIYVVLFCYTAALLLVVVGPLFFLFFCSFLFCMRSSMFCCLFPLRCLCSFFTSAVRFFHSSALFFFFLPSFLMDFFSFPTSSFTCPPAALTSAASYAFACTRPSASSTLSPCRPRWKASDSLSSFWAVSTLGRVRSNDCRECEPVLGAEGEEEGVGVRWEVERMGVVRRGRVGSRTVETAAWLRVARLASRSARAAFIRRLASAFAFHGSTEAAEVEEAEDDGAGEEAGGVGGAEAVAVPNF